MSIQTTQVVIPAKTEEQVTSVRCDLCGATYQDARPDCNEISWRGRWVISNTAVRFVSGLDGPDGGGGAGTWEYHICPMCFQNRLEPWLQEQGARPTIKETTW